MVANTFIISITADGEYKRKKYRKENLLKKAFFPYLISLHFAAAPTFPDTKRLYRHGRVEEVSRKIVIINITSVATTHVVDNKKGLSRGTALSNPPPASSLPPSPYFSSMTL